MEMVGTNYQNSNVSTQMNETANVRPSLVYTREQYRHLLDRWVGAPKLNFDERGDRWVASIAMLEAFDRHASGKRSRSGYYDAELNYSALTTCPPLFEGLERLNICSTNIAQPPGNRPLSLLKIHMKDGVYDRKERQDSL